MVLTQLKNINPTFLHSVCWRISAGLTEIGGPEKEDQK